MELAGSARRLADTCKDLDIVAAAKDPAKLVAAFAALAPVDEVTTSGEAGAKAVTHQGLAVDLRIVPEESFGNLLQHFTGSGRHNEALRTAAVKRGLHVSEYGVADDNSGETHACATEEEVYELLGMAWVPPELRENRGELEAARDGGLPALVLTRGHPGRPALPHHRLGRPQHDHRDGRGARRRAATSTSRSPTTPRATASATR